MHYELTRRHVIAGITARWLVFAMATASRRTIKWLTSTIISQGYQRRCG